jgi:hypothetical protein
MLKFGEIKSFEFKIKTSALRVTNGEKRTEIRIGRRTAFFEKYSTTKVK